MRNMIFVGIKVLIVEDQPDAREVLKKLLLDMGVDSVFETKDGTEALAFITASPDSVNLVVCDWNMPKMNGLDLLRQVRLSNPDMPFIMVTGRSDLDSVVEAKDSGVTGYLRKPYSAKELEAKLRIISMRMRNKRQEMQLY